MTKPIIASWISISAHAAHVAHAQILVFGLYNFQERAIGSFAAMRVPYLRVFVELNLVHRLILPRKPFSPKA